MKCDELQRHSIRGEMYNGEEICGGFAYYDADAIAELKQKLEDVQATSYAESVDAGMENRRLKRALWLARARTACLEFKLFVKDSVDAVDSIEVDNAERMAIKWKKVERKCRAKAEEYDNGLG